MAFLSTTPRNYCAKQYYVNTMEFLMVCMYMYQLNVGVWCFQCEAGALSEHHGFPGGDQRRVPAPMEGVSGDQQ